MRTRTSIGRELKEGKEEEEEDETTTTPPPFDSSLRDLSMVEEEEGVVGSLR